MGAALLGLAICSDLVMALRPMLQIKAVRDEATRQANAAAAEIKTVRAELERAIERVREEVSAEGNVARC